MDRRRENPADRGRVVIRVCFHGAESTGKSTMAKVMAARFDCPWVAEFGRGYCEARGINLAMADLLAIAEGQNKAMREAAASSPPLLLLDTDPLMTAAWARMLFGEVPAELLDYPKADLYLNFAADVPWISDGTRFFGTDATRELFAAIAEDMLVRGGVRFESIGGDWAARERTVTEILTDQAETAVTM